MAFIFLFVFSILPKFPKWNQKIKYVFCRTEMFSFFPCRGPLFCTLTACQDRDSVAEVAVRPHCFTFLSWAEEVVGKEDQGTGFGESD